MIKSIFFIKHGCHVLLVEEYSSRKKDSSMIAHKNHGFSDLQFFFLL